MRLIRHQHNITPLIGTADRYYSDAIMMPDSIGSADMSRAACFPIMAAGVLAKLIRHLTFRDLIPLCCCSWLQNWSVSNLPAREPHRLNLLTLQAPKIKYVWVHSRNWCMYVCMTVWHYMYVSLYACVCIRSHVCSSVRDICMRVTIVMWSVTACHVFIIVS